MKNSIGTDITIIEDSSIYEEIDMLSSQEAELLRHVLSELDGFKKYGRTLFNVDDRGVKVVIEETADTIAVDGLIVSGLVLIHPDSDLSIAYLSVNRDVYDMAVSTNLYNPM